MSVNLSGLGHLVDVMVGWISSAANFAGHLGIWLIIIIFGYVIYRRIRSK